MNSGAIPIDSAWIAANPLPIHNSGTTKNSRGRVLAIGGSRMVPGAIRLTGEAALRVGAGKLQMATVSSAAVMLGLLTPEAGSIALSEDEQGEITPQFGEPLEKALADCDVAVIGPGIGDADAATQVLRRALAEQRDDLVLVVDALAIGTLPDLHAEASAFAGRLILTPHYGEMALLTGRDEKDIAAVPDAIAREAAADFGAIVVLKGSSTVVADCDGALL
jgi:ADP-dependent NAD(P)H-hydrate dehydratase